MYIKKLNIENFKCFKGKFSIELNSGVNILVGNNETGKSTILEAIHLALRGVLNGRYLRNELSQYLFNNEVVNEYINSLKTDNPQPPPYILIEVFFDDIDFPMFEGNGNSEKIQECGLAFKIKFDDGFKDEYEDLITPAKINTIPVEYYKISWKSFAREPITSRSIPLKSVVIDSSSYRYQNGSDVYISRIIRDDLEISEKVNMAQAYRMLKEEFSKNDAIKEINRKITEKTKVSNKNLHISVDLSSSNSWETVLMTYLDEIPFHQIGKGEQCIIKTSLALEHEKSEEANMILIEEPECHLSHTKLNQLLKSIRGKCDEKQILISTHSSFVANKLGLEHLIFLSNSKVAMLKDLTADTQKFFQKLPGYQTLRLILCQKALLVEGPSDELIVQKAYMKNNEGRLPIEEGIDVISVGLSFKRFLEIAKKLKHPVAVITDNDGDYDVNIIKKYADYSSEEYIKICADNRNPLKTLEYQFVDANKNQLEVLRKALVIKESTYDTEEKVIKYMIDNKTTWALRVFESNEDVNYPKYIFKAVKWCNE